ncbi:hypothetical protein CF326_g9975, partial [Tilletia indica]
ALGLPDYNVTTARLQAYHPDGDASAMTLYVAYVPLEYVEKLSEMIKDPTSKFYTAAPSAVGAQLAAHVDRQFNILSVVPGTKFPGDGASADGSKSGSSSLKSALIGVSCALGAVIVLFFAWRMWKRKQSGQIQLRDGQKGDRRLTIASFAGLSNPDHHGGAPMYVAGAGAGAAGGVHRSGSGSDRATLREMWEPSGEERQRAISGGNNALTETWEISDAEAAANGMDLYAAGYGSASHHQQQPATGMLVDTQFVIDDGEHAGDMNAQGIMREMDGSYVSVQRAASAFGRQSGVGGADADPFADASGVSPLPTAVTNPHRTSRMTERSDGSGGSKAESVRESFYGGGNVPVNKERSLTPNT